MAQEVKYLSYSGLSHFKDRVFEVINPLISENKANILSIQNFLENPVFEVVNTNTLNVISEINLNGTRLFNFDFLPLSGGTMTGTITSQSIIPSKTHTTSDAAYSLGSSSKQFNTTYTRFIDTVSGFNLRLRSGGVEHLNMISGNVNSTANIIPTATNTYNLGTTTNMWKNVCATTFVGKLNGSIAVKDIRELTGVTSNFNNSTFNPFFSNVTMPSSNWYSGFTSKGWSNDYNSWQLIGYSGQGDGSAQDLYYRYGVNDVWNSWKKLLDNSNTTYTPTVTSSTSGAYQIGTIKIGDAETIIYGKDTNTTYTSLKNPYKLTIQGNGTTLTNGEYDGSAAKTVNITPASIGAAAAPVTYRTQSNETGFYKISINSTTAWMLAFRVRVYKQYQYFDIRFSGYNYQSNHWHAAQASLIDGDANITVYMGYDDINKMWVAIPASQYTGIEIADCVNGFASAGKPLNELFTITRIDSLSGTTQHTYTLYTPSKSNHTHSYLPLSGGTISSSSFCPLVIERSGSTNMASLRFKNSNGILGSIGMNTVYGSLLLHNADGSASKTILDSSNYNIYAAAKSHSHEYIPTSEKVNATAVSHTGYGTNGTYVPTMNFLSYWNGAYNSNNVSSLTYCNQGKFGTIVTKNTGDYLPISGGTLTGDLSFNMANDDRFINFNYNNGTTYSWRLGYLGSGSGDANYFTIQSAKAAGTQWYPVVNFGNETLNANFAGDILPMTSNTKNLGSSSLKWANVYATTLYENGTSLVNKYATKHTHTELTNTEIDAIFTDLGVTF